MFLVLAAYLGGVLTISSPCILPVLPFVLARSNQPLTRSGLPILLGMAITFVAVASLAAVGGGWVVEANYYGRLAAILLIALFGITLLLPGLAERMTRNIVALGAAADAAPVMKAGPNMMMMAAQQPAVRLPVEGRLPSLAGTVDWLNSPPLTAEALRGHVVLVDFWTYSCINCLRTLPYIEAWAKKYRDQGLIVIGVHAPEFAFERNIDNVRAAVKRLGIDYPVAIDNNYAIWRGFNNEYWPAHYFIDADGRIRSHHFGEGSDRPRD